MPPAAPGRLTAGAAAPSRAGGPHRRHSRLATALAFALVVGAAHAQRKPDDAAAERVALTVAWVDACAWMDDLHRSTCARIGAQLSERNRSLCVRADGPFGERVAADYAAFRERNRAVIAANEPKIESVAGAARSSLERQFSKLRAGQVSMLDLESLSRELAGRCRVVATEWLAPR